MDTPPSAGSLQSLSHSPRPVRFGQDVQGPVAWRGSLEASRVVAIVGSRKPSPESLHFARTLAAACAQAGVVVASGGASGIDLGAHRAALDAGGVTWAVLATPPGRYFPAEHAEFLQALPSHGNTVVWTATAGAPTPRCFHRRNRVLVSIADVVVVVQAAKRSGSMNAGSHALALQRPLLVVPGCPWDERFGGSIELLAGGARVVDGPDRVLRALGVEGLEGKRTPTHQAFLPLVLPRLCQPLPSGLPPALLRAISQVPLLAEEIATRAQLDLATTLCGLLTLSLENVVVEDLAGRYRLA